MTVASDNNEYPDATIELFSAVADQWLDPEKRKELVDSLRSDPHVRAVYIEQAIVHSLLFRKARRDDVAPLLSELILEHTVSPSGLADELALPGSSPNSPIPTFVSATLHNTFGYFPEGMPLAYLVATVVTGLGILIASHVYMSQPEQFARQ